VKQNLSVKLLVLPLEPPLLLLLLLLLLCRLCAVWLWHGRAPFSAPQAAVSSPAAPA
jgi:uncharacterized iron-regulated membrane protein